MTDHRYRRHSKLNGRIPLLLQGSYTTSRTAWKIGFNVKKSAITFIISEFRCEETHNEKVTHLI